MPVDTGMHEQVLKTLRTDKFPHIWCAGCGDGIVLQAFVTAIIKLGLNQDKLVVASGIGCSSRAVGYLNLDTLHTAHGRAIPFATGIKMFNPELTVAVLAGDGDIAAIGGNHFIHAARRNIDITVVVFNNLIYGMTGGQASPTTIPGDMATTSPYGHIERPFDISNLAIAAGATFVARTTSYHAVQLPKFIMQGISHKGFSVIEVMTGCHTYYGRLNRIGSAVEMLEWQRDHALNQKQYQLLSDEEKLGKFEIGVLHSEERPEYTDEYARIIEKARGKIPGKGAEKDSAAHGEGPLQKEVPQRQREDPYG